MARKGIAAFALWMVGSCIGAALAQGLPPDHLTVAPLA